MDKKLYVLKEIGNGETLDMRQMDRGDFEAAQEGTIAATDGQFGWVEQEVSELSIGFQFERGPIVFTRVDAPYGITFVVESPDGNEFIYDGQAALDRVAELRKKYEC